MSEELCLTIPCKVDGKPKGPQPIYVGLPQGYLCPHCGASRQRHTTMSRHMGLVMNIPASCPVFKKQDAEHRAALKKYMDDTREKVEPEMQSLEDGLWEIREREKMNRQDD